MAVLMVTWWAPQDKACERERERESRAKSVVFSELVALPRRLYLQEGCFQEGATAPYNEFPCDESGSLSSSTLLVGVIVIIIVVIVVIYDH